MTRQHIRRGVFRSIVDLQSAINAYPAEHNAQSTHRVRRGRTILIPSSLGRDDSDLNFFPGGGEPVH
jgi:hypothetical protein